MNRRRDDWQDLVWAGWSRRRFLMGIAATTALTACGSKDGADSATTAGTEGDAGEGDGGADVDPDTGEDARDSDVPFGVWKEVQAALRTSPDHLAQEAERVVASADSAKIFAFVRDRIATIPGEVNGLGGVARCRWGLRGTLRSGTGTLRDKAELVANLLQRAGFDAEVQEVRTPEDSLFVERVLSFQPDLEFLPEVNPGDLARWRSLLGLEQAVSPDVIDPLHEQSEQIASSLLDVLPTDARVVNGFSFSKPSYMPIVAIEKDGATVFANVAEPGIAFGEVGSPHQPRPTGAPGALPNVTLRFSMVTTASPREPVELVSGTFALEDVIGRQVSVAMVPPEDIRTLLSMRFADVGTFLPVLSVQGSDLLEAEREALFVAGKAVNIQGDVYEVSEQGEVILNGQVIDTEPVDTAMIERVESLSLEVLSTGFPDVRVRASALDSAGNPVQGLPAAAFELTEDDRNQGFSLLENRSPAAKVLFLLDQSSSLPPEFLGDGAASVLRTIVESLLPEEPDALFRVLMVGGNQTQGEWTNDPSAIEQAVHTQSSFGSGLWSALAAAVGLQPTTVVMITDGAATDQGTSQRLAAISKLPPCLYLGLGPGPFVSLDSMAEITGGMVLPVAQQNEAVQAALEMIRSRREGSFLFRYRAQETGSGERTVTLSLSGTARMDQGKYFVPELEDRMPGPRVGGLLLDVEIEGFGSTRQVVAGVEEIPTDATEDLFETVHAAMFGAAEIRIEGGPPTFSAMLDDLISARLSMEPLWNALQGGNPEDIVDRFAEGFERYPATALAVNAAAAPSGSPTFPTGPRVVLTTAQPRYGQGVISRISMTTLGSYRSAVGDRREEFAKCLQATARHAVIEGALYEVSTLSLLQGKDLVGLRPFAVIGSHVDLTPEKSAAWSGVFKGYQSGYRIVPAAGEPIAFWYVDPRTGALLGILPDGSGGGSSKQELEATLDRWTSVLNWANATGGYFGVLGWQGGVWLALEKAKLKKLIGATIAIATMEAPPGIGDFSGVAGDVACDAVKGVVGEGFGSLANFAGSAIVRALAASGKGILQADAFIEAGTGGAAINC